MSDLNVKQNRSYMQFDELELKCYTPEEVQRISVLEITEANTFDEAGFPVRGGLYDPRLGGTEDFSICETCGLSPAHCPGHFGHIELTVPVFNPMLFSFTYSLIKGTCIHCHRFTFDTNSTAAKILIAKVRALIFGVPEVLNGIDGAVKSHIESNDLLAERMDILSEEAVLEELDRIIAKLACLKTIGHLRDMGLARVRHQSQLKNNVNEKHNIIREFLRGYLFKHKSRCPRCKRSNGEIRNDSGQALILDFSKQSAAKDKKRQSEASIAKLVAIEKAKQMFGVGGPGRPGVDDNSRPDLGYGVEMEQEDDEESKKSGAKNFKSQAVGFAPSTLLDPLLLSDRLLAQQLEQVLSGKFSKLVWRAAEVREHFRLLWQRESILLRQIFPLFCSDENENIQDQQFQEKRPLRSPIDVLFVETLMVGPSRFRPIRYLHGERYEHPATINLRKLLEANQLISLVKFNMQHGDAPNTEGLPQLGLAAKELLENRIQGKTMNEKLHNSYLELQMRANCLFDERANKTDGAGNALPGLKQTLEKKEGLFRMHMMGKRVNFACRSVITPDPYLDIDEIGIPELFACRLTFPESVTNYNIESLAELIRRGPAEHPGANYVEISGKLGKPPSKIKLLPGREMKRERVFQSKRLTTGGTDESVHDMPDTVLRHLQNGDRLLMNRQPSLHKPSIMGHRARVLRGQNALRMNYAPCKAYNADFDGDEMNGHFVQNRVAQCEVAELANVGNNFLVPKDGTPILGLIQDHVVSGVLMTQRGQFFEKEDYMHLVLSAFAETRQRLKIPPPTIVWPKRLWSGKQVVTAIVQNCCPANHPYINLSGKAKTSINCWKSRDPKSGKELPAPKFEMSESEVIFRQGELLCGVLDKAHYGATQFGLIHCCYELYGPKVAVHILSYFSRVFTTYLQFHGFTLGVADILVTKKANKQRRNTIQQLRKCGDGVIKKTFGLSDDVMPGKIRYSMATAYNHPTNRDTVKLIDYSMKQALNKYAEQINSACVPSGLIRDFPQNALQLMIQSGSKGSLVNSIQISCALGQIELEGQRPPRSITGRSLPSFRSFDPSPRAGGFIEQRFLTGIDPQELFFHTMAGREGLVDTAVKTSRSGYLQRCIIKHLEGLTIRYDQTVRDYDNSIIQFRYGEDGLDIGRSTFLNSKQFPFLYENSEALRQLAIPQGIRPEDEQNKWHLADTEMHYKRISKFKRKRMRYQLLQENINAKMDVATINKGFRRSAFNEFQMRNDYSYLTRDSIISDWKRLSIEERAKYMPKYVIPPEPVDVAFHPSTNLGALSEHNLDQLNNFIQKHSTEEASEIFKKAMYWKGLRAFADPGECVGLLAAQSIGEPSTQMTLNTFHFAGRGEMNVTLGIPRLREILMTQSKNISTPMAEICIRAEVTDEQVEKLKCELNPVKLRQLLRSFDLDERIHVDATGNYFREYALTLELLKNEKRDPFARHLKRRRIMQEIEARFGGDLASIMAKRYKDVLDHQQIQHRKLRANNMDSSAEEGKNKKKQQDEDLASDEEDAIGGLQGEADAHEVRLNRRHMDDAAEYEGEEQDRGDAGIDEVDEDDNIAEVGQQEDSEAEERVEDEEEEAEEDTGSSTTRTPKTSVLNKDRIEAALRANPLLVDYHYDTQGERWCQFVLRLPLRNKGTIDAMALVEREIDKFVVTQVRGVEKCVVREEEKNGQMMRILQTQGINLEAFHSRSRLLDVNTIYSNDIDLILRKYGVEAANRTIVKEMNNVFGVYGIEVNPRHLTLTADYMTFTGNVQAFNRGAMAQSSSPLQKMTFETTVAFMQQAIVNGQYDSLFSPSARLVLGQLVRGGTGAFDLLIEHEYASKGNGKKGTTPKTQLGKDIMEMRSRRQDRKTQYYGQTF